MAGRMEPLYLEQLGALWQGQFVRQRHRKFHLLEVSSISYSPLRLVILVASSLAIEPAISTLYQGCPQPLKASGNMPQNHPSSLGEGQSTAAPDAPPAVPKMRGLGRRPSVEEKRAMRKMCYVIRAGAEAPSTTPSSPRCGDALMLPDCWELNRRAICAPAKLDWRLWGGRRAELGGGMLAQGGDGLGMWPFGHTPRP